MASKTFTPSNAVDMLKEKDWAANLGMLDWDSTQIVFTKRKLLEFLKYVDVTVDPNFSSISKLPRYAQFMNVATDDQDGATVDEHSATQSLASSSFKPSRRVRTAPGGATSDIFGLEGTDDDALSQAPSLQQSSSKDSMATVAVQDEVTAPQAQPTTIEGQAAKPSRRVRTAPGGKDSLSEMWGSMDVNTTEETFKPTRRVRQIPGGQDNLAGDLK